MPCIYTEQHRYTVVYKTTKRIHRQQLCTEQKKNIHAVSLRDKYTLLTMF